MTHFKELEKLEEMLKDYKCSPATLKPNYCNIPCTVLTPNEENCNIFNNLLRELKSLKLAILTRTKSNGIHYGANFRIPSYHYSMSTSGSELIILLASGYYRIQFRPALDQNNNETVMSGRKAFNKFKDICKDKYGINLEDYAVENGKEVKQQIEKPMIKMERQSYIGLTLENCHHIDFHNSYPAGLVNTHPEFKDVITMLYNKRKVDKVYKAVLNYTIGFMQSQWVGYKYAALSRDAINDNNRRIRELAERLKASGRMVIAYNTDGIWYRGEVYHDENEGSTLGTWANDHTNCKLRFKSAGSYEFIENDEYYPVVRGYTKLDRIKPRAEWSWGDIYSNEAGVIQYVFDDDGIHEVCIKEF